MQEHPCRKLFPSLAHIRGHVFSCPLLGMGDSTPCHTCSLFGSCRMSDAVLRVGFSRSSIYSTLPTPTCVLKGFSPLASFLFAGLAEPQRCRQALEAQQLF